MLPTGGKPCKSSILPMTKLESGYSLDGSSIQGQDVLLSRGVIA